MIFFCVRMSMPAEYWHVPRVIYLQKFHPTRSLLFILAWGGMWCRFLVLLGTLALLPLAHPTQFCHGWVFSRVCWAFACDTVFQSRLLSFRVSG